MRCARFLRGLKVCAALLLATHAVPVHAQSLTPRTHPLFDGDRVHVMHLTFAQPGWYDLLRQNFEGLADPLYAPASFDWDGLRLATIGVRFKGNSSYIGYPGDKKSFKLDINEFVSGQNIAGIDKLNLHNIYHDPSFVREKMWYELAAEQGLAAPRVNYAALYINDQYWGLYTVVEQVDEEFLQSRFGPNEAGNLWKGDPLGSLEWLGAGATPYQANYELETNETANDWSSLVDLCDRLNNPAIGDLPAALNPVLDLASATTYLALCEATATLDTYIGRGHNLYYYRRDSDGRFAIVPWDANESFGGFAFSMGTAQLQALPPEWLLAPADRHPLAWRLWQNPDWFAAHRGAMRKVLAGGMQPDRALARATALRDLVRPWVRADHKKMYSDADFEAALTSDIPAAVVGPVPALDTFIRTRHAYLTSLVGGAPVEPRIRINEVVGLNLGGQLDEHGEADPWVEIANASANPVDLAGLKLATELSGSRIYDFPAQTLAPGARLVVWCDGQAAQGPLHAPFRLAAGPATLHLLDGGAVADIARLPAAAGNTSQARYPDLSGDFRQVSQPTPLAANLVATPPTILVNELLATNVAGVVDEAGDHEDWLELHNPNPFDVDLAGWSLSDTLLQPQKWTLPAVTIPAGGHLLVWCDNEAGEGPLHANFKFGAQGEAAVLSASAAYGRVVVDARVFGPQRTDISEGRVSDGAAQWVSCSPPTPGAANAGGAIEAARVVPYGVGKPTSSNWLPAMAWSGTPSLASNDFQLVVVDARPGAPGLAFSGPGRASIPFNGGTRWVAGPITRLAVQNADASGRSVYPVATTATMVGTTRCYQHWFRDALQTDGTGCGLSAALEVRYGP